MGTPHPELRAVLPENLEVIDRSTVNAWHDDRVRSAIEATGRDKILIAGVSLEVCAAFPAIAATAAGHTAYVAVDASGTFSATKRETGLLRLRQAGVIVSDYASLAVEILADNAHPIAPELYADLDMPFATLVGQLAAVRG
ncbi:isochorismatase family protein [Streptomyces sp. XD-27]|uniref:isochorismatase family protein n=1 Tax=Streptomyces sp. XD-27 TaxID=3062779 RepID=UPI0026F4454E|nr:isochorismatase family protein [Streptomyces sp. XD-27]WKX69328.1 isochorismatase family protein [Streptomyces sp. XD-27]